MRRFLWRQPEWQRGAVARYPWRGAGGRVLGEEFVTAVDLVVDVAMLLFMLGMIFKSNGKPEARARPRSHMVAGLRSRGMGVGARAARGVQLQSRDEGQAGMVSFFGRKRDGEGRGRPTLLTGPRIPRHSSGWEALLKHLRAENGLRVLDIGPTSPQNINFLTEMGHSVYMADVVQEALRKEWQLPPLEEGEPVRFDEAGFFEQNLNFHGRQFDVVLLWATLDYIPEGLIAPLVSRLKDATLKDGKVLAIFHTKPTGPYTAYCRYHLTGISDIEMQESEPFQVLRVYTNRKIEQYFKGWSGIKFFLAKDNLYEVIVTR
jgi:hypothetical protein